MRVGKKKFSSAHKHVFFAVGAFALSLGGIYTMSSSSLFTVTYDPQKPVVKDEVPVPKAPVLDKVAYDAKILAVANNPAPSTTTASSTKPTLWPPKTVYPNPGALLPFNRILAYYGNFYSKQMGALGEYEADDMLARLQAEAAHFEAADPATPVVPAIEYIAVTAQESPGKDGKYRLRMPESQLDHALALAKRINGIVILDIQIGLSSLEAEITDLDNYLSKPEVHLALDPEFAMKNGAKPGTVIGSMDAADINYAAEHLAKLVREHNLPPKILIIHRFTHNMVKRSQEIRPLPEVQIVMVMDGWGSPAKKIGTYNQVIYPEPVQFAGFKIFYKNDVRPPSTRLLTPAEVLDLSPQPLFIQYQ